jgi:hypothetical protein
MLMRLNQPHGMSRLTGAAWRCRCSQELFIQGGGRAVFGGCAVSRDSLNQPRGEESAQQDGPDAQGEGEVHGAREDRACVTYAD